MTKVRTLFDWLLVRPERIPTQTAQGIVLPTNCKSMMADQIRGHVLVIGSGYRSEQNGQHFPVPVQVGDWIVFDRRAGRYDVVDGEELVFLKEGDIMAVLEESAA